MKYKRIRSLARGIEVLRYLNRVKGACPVDIGKALGLPRPTVHRILEAFEELELVYQGLNSRVFRLTPSVRKLAGGGNKFDILRAIAGPVLRELTAEVVWPCGLAVLHESAMLVIESTYRQSSMSSEIGMVGQSYPLLLSALGQTYLSHCDAARRGAIIADLCAHAVRHDLPVDDLEVIDDMVKDGHREGFSMWRDLPDGRFASIAVPVRLDGTTIASISIMWNVVDLTFEQAYERLSGPLLAARDRIETKLQESTRLNSAACVTIGQPHAPKSAYTKRTETSFNVPPTPQGIKLAALKVSNL
jgi:IclR family mhp operon transcriptional activator